MPGLWFRLRRILTLFFNFLASRSCERLKPWKFELICCILGPKQLMYLFNCYRSVCNVLSFPFQVTKTFNKKLVLSLLQAALRHRKAAELTTFTLQWKLYILTMLIKDGQLENLGSKCYQTLTLLCLSHLGPIQMLCLSVQILCRR